MWLRRHDELDSPLALLARLGDEIDRTFGARGAADVLALDVHETEAAFHLRVPLPGVRPEDIEVLVENGVLRVAGSWSATPSVGRHLVRERRAGKFERRLQLPERVDPGDVTARYEDGILHVLLAKHAEAATRRVEVSVA